MGYGAVIGNIANTATATSTSGGFLRDTWDWITGRDRAAEADERQRRNNEEAARLNFQYGEQGAQNEMQRATEFYLKYSSPEAMRRQYEEAGLNPALMYGGGGAGGTGQSAPNAGHGDAGNVPPVNVAQLEMAEQQRQSNQIQRALALSQSYKNFTDAGLSNAEAQQKLFDLGVDKETRGEKIAGKTGEYASQTAKGIVDSQVIEADKQRRKNEGQEAEWNQMKAKSEAIVAELEAHRRMYEETNGEYDSGNITNPDGSKKHLSDERKEQIREQRLQQVIENNLKRGLKTLQDYDVRQSDVNTKIIEKNAKEISDMTVAYMRGELTNQDYQNGMTAWSFNNKELFKTIDVVTGVAKQVGQIYGINKMTKAIGSKQPITSKVTEGSNGYWRRESYNY